jgi:hypothetical protein
MAEFGFEMSGGISNYDLSCEHKQYCYFIGLVHIRRFDASSFHFNSVDYLSQVETELSSPVAL